MVQGGTRNGLHDMLGLCPAVPLPDLLNEGPSHGAPWSEDGARG
jgi:hypothetical protein